MAQSWQQDGQSPNAAGHRGSASAPVGGARPVLDGWPARCDACPVTDLRVLNAEQVEALLDPEALREALTEAMIGLSNGSADVPPRVGTQAEGGVLLAMPGYLEGVGLATKLITVFPGNVEVPSHQGVIVLFDHRTGTPLALLDAEVISGARTAMTAAIAADRLAGPEAAVLTIVGGGAQAVAHAKAFVGLRRWTEVRAVNRSQPAAVVVAGAAREAGAREAVAFEDFRDAVVGADVIALCTHADTPVIDPSWVGDGSHVSSVGSRAELPPGLLGRGPVVVEWRAAVTTPPPAGAAELQDLDPATVVELGELLQDDALGRSGPNEISIYKSTGHAVQDVAAAALVYQRALAEAVGTIVAL